VINTRVDLHWTRAASPQVLVAQTSGKSMYILLLDATRATRMRRAYEAYAESNCFGYLATQGLFASESSSFNLEPYKPIRF
jgi:hypothetical protein